jgi:hypothetical protein
MRNTYKSSTAGQQAAAYDQLRFFIAHCCFSLESFKSARWLPGADTVYIRTVSGFLSLGTVFRRIALGCLFALHVALQLSDGTCIWDLEFVKSLLYFIKKGDFESPYMCSNDNDA